jgi:hypothetical protein
MINSLKEKIHLISEGLPFNFLREGDKNTEKLNE